MATDHFGTSENVWPVYWEKPQCKHDSLLIHGAKGKAQEACILHEQSGNKDSCEPVTFVIRYQKIM